MKLVKVVITLSKIKELTCGIIMPIASMHGYPAEHWLDVKQIITEATQSIDGYNFKTEIVSNSDGEIDVIHKRIIQNLYNSDVVVCDISGKNPNVLFELGMRLTFDKPTIIIKDDQTDFIFDTGVIEHLTYPQDLRFQKVVEFKNELSRRIIATYDKSQSDSNFSTFLKSFGEFQVPKLEQTEVTDVDKILLEEVKSLRKEFTSIRNEFKSNNYVEFKNQNSKTKELNAALNLYFRETNDSDTPRKIMEKDEFQSFLIKLDIQPKLYSKISLLEAINAAQTRHQLPF